MFPMRKKGASARLPAREGKILAATYEIMAEGYDPSSSAVALLLRGDERVERFSYLKTYGSLTSYSPKKLKTMVSALLKRGFLTSYAPPRVGEQYLLLTPLGEAEAQRLLAKPIRKIELAPTPPLFQERK